MTAKHLSADEKFPERRLVGQKNDRCYDSASQLFYKRVQHPIARYNEKAVVASVRGIDEFWSLGQIHRFDITHPPNRLALFLRVNKKDDSLGELLK